MVGMRRKRLRQILMAAATIPVTTGGDDSTLDPDEDSVLDGNGAPEGGGGVDAPTFGCVLIVV
jgi:hypothetical protein